MSYYFAIMALTIALLFILGVLVMENAQLTKKGKRQFLFSYSIVALAACSEWLGIFFSGKVDYPVWVIILVKFCDYIFTPASGAALMWNFECNKKIRKAAIIVLVLNFVFQVLSLTGGGVFYVDEMHVYHHGMLYNGYILIYATILIITSIALFDHGKHYSHENRMSLNMVIVFAIGGIVVQEFVGGGIRIAYLTLAIAMGVLYIRYSEFTLQESNIRIQNQQYQMLFSQIQPHFLFNCLSVIREVYHLDMELGDTAIMQFSSFLRYNMDSLSEEDVVPFEKELEHVKEYIALQRLRFFDALDVEMDLKCTDFEIPILTLQPIVENAIRYGARNNPDGAGKVSIRTWEDEHFYYIEVTDNGMGFEEGQKKSDQRSHIGITNVKQRLQIFLNAKMSIRSTLGEGTVVTITIPKRGESA